MAPDRSLWRVDFATGRSKPIAEGVMAFLCGQLPIVAVERLIDSPADGPCLLELRSSDVRDAIELLAAGSNGRFERVPAPPEHASGGVGARVRSSPSGCGTCR